MPASAPQSSSRWPWLLLAVWGAGAAAVLVSWWRQWRPVRAALQRAKPIWLDAQDGAADLAVMSSACMPEPGVIGIRRPRLLLPEGIVERLAPPQLRALIAQSGVISTAVTTSWPRSTWWSNPLLVPSRGLVDRKTARRRTRARLRRGGAASRRSAAGLRSDNLCRDRGAAWPVAGSRRGVCRGAHHRSRGTTVSELAKLRP